MAFSLWVEHLFGEDDACGKGDQLCPILQNNLLSIQIMLIGILAVTYRLAFRNAVLNLWEYSVGLGYLVAQGTILGGVVELIISPISSGWGSGAGLVVFLAYLFFGIIRLLQIRGVLQVLAAILLGVLAIVVFMGLLIVTVVLLLLAE